MKTFSWNKEQLYDLYVNQRLSSCQIAPLFGVNSRTIRRQLNVLGIKPKTSMNKPRKILWDKEQLYDLYVNQKLSSLEIEKILSIPSRSIRRKLSRLGMQTRSLSEANTKKKKLPFSGDLGEKSYLLGLRAGDFHCKPQHLCYRFQTSTTHQAQFELLEEALSKYAQICTYYFEAKGAKAKSDEIFIYADLHSSFSFLLEKPVEIPGWILETNEYFFQFLAAYIDSEGCFRVKKVIKIPYDLCLICLLVILLS